MNGPSSDPSFLLAHNERWRHASHMQVEQFLSLSLLLLLACFRCLLTDVPSLLSGLSRVHMYLKSSVMRIRPNVVQNSNFLSCQITYLAENHIEPT